MGGFTKMKINNCPFCGGDHVRSGHYHPAYSKEDPRPDDGMVFYAGCWMCDVFICYGDSEEDAIKKWNGELKEI